MSTFSLRNHSPRTIASGVGLLFVTAVLVVLTALSVIRFWQASSMVIAMLLTLAAVGYRFYVKRLEQKNKQISEFNRVHMATVEALATAIDARDQVGMGHVRRTQIYAVRLGELLGLSQAEIDALRTGALLHDIGKLAVPDHILNKPGKLTQAEVEKTKIHPIVGAEILEKVGFHYPVVPTVKYHHEAWDGSGYPDGLTGTEIPLTARILCVADAYDTLRGARPYRKAIPRDDARKILRDQAGTRFDPGVVQMLIKNLTSIEAEIAREGLAYSEVASTEIHDSSESRPYAEQIKQANREVFNLYELARDFSGSLTLDETLHLFATKVREFVPFDTCALYVLDDEKRFATAMNVEGEYADLLVSRRVRVGQGATGFALKTRKAVQNVDPDLDFSYSQTELVEQYQTMAAVPLVSDDNELLGAVTIYSRELAKYGEEHLRLFETISRIAADAIHKALEHHEAKTHALTDPMTGLANARSLQIEFDKEVARAGRAGTTFQVIMLDLDGFKSVNDSFGHKIGDEMLRSVARVIQEQLRDYDFLARYGGDEFVALIPETSGEDIADLCRRIQKAVSEFSLPVAGEKTARVGVSIGSSSYDDTVLSFDQMIVAADKAMYEQKQRRRRPISRPQEPLLDLGLPTESFIVELDESHILATTSVN